MSHNPSSGSTLQILLPTHNRADVLPFAIESVINQTYQDFELWIVGDGCTDQTPEVISSFPDPRIQWLDLPKAPHFGYANRNIAFKQMRREFVGFMAHDDILLPDHFEKLVGILQKNPDLELAYSRPGWVTLDGLIMGIEFNLLNKTTRIPFLEKKHNALPASCVVHRRSCFEKYGYWNEDLPARGDWDMWVRIISGSDKINFAFLPEVTCLHFVAIWKNDRNSLLQEAAHWRTLYESMEDLPRILSRPIEEGKKEQEIIWNEIKPDPHGWAKELRFSLSRVTDLRIETLVKDQSEIHREIIKLQKENQQLVTMNTRHDLLLKKKERLAEMETSLEILQWKLDKIENKIETWDPGITTSLIKNLQDKIEIREKQIDTIFQSYSWKIGRTITRIIAFLLGWIPGKKW